MSLLWKIVFGHKRLEGLLGLVPLLFPDKDTVSLINDRVGFTTCAEIAARFRYTILPLSNHEEYLDFIKEHLDYESSTYFYPFASTRDGVITYNKSTATKATLWHATALAVLQHADLPVNLELQWAQDLGYVFMLSTGRYPSSVLAMCALRETGPTRSALRGYVDLAAKRHGYSPDSRVPKRVGTLATTRYVKEICGPPASLLLNLAGLLVPDHAWGPRLIAVRRYDPERLEVSDVLDALSEIARSESKYARELIRVPEAL